MANDPTSERIAVLLEQLLSIAQQGSAEMLHHALSQLNAAAPTGMPVAELRQKLLSVGIQIADQQAGNIPVMTLAAELYWRQGDEGAALQRLEQVLKRADYPNAHLLAGSIHVRRRDLAHVQPHVERLTMIAGHLAETQDYAGAFLLQRQLYQRIGREYEDEDFVYGVMHPVHLIMDRAGRQFAERFGRFDGKPARNGRHRIAFLFPVGALLAHSEVVLMMCSGLAKLADHLIEPIIYVFDQIDPAFQNAFAACGVDVRQVPKMDINGPVIFGKMINLRSILASEEIDTAVWVSVPVDANFYFGYRVAPRQAYWSMKFHTLITPGVDHLVSCGSWAQSEKTVHDRRWVIGSVAFADPLRDADLAAAAKIRADFAQFQPLLGVLAREEKIHSLPYLEAVARILEQHPKAGFIWTGRTEHPAIRDFFAARGLGERARWVGWVHTATYVHALDIFLETFPFGCGMTSAQALAAGKPLISYRDWTTVMGHHFAPVLEKRAGDAATQRELTGLFTGRRGDSLFLMADSADDYVEMAGRVIDDPILREDLSALGRELVQRYLANSEMAARRFADIFRDIDRGD